MDVVSKERRKVENNGMYLRNFSAILNKYVYICDRQISHRNEIMNKIPFTENMSSYYLY